MIQAPAFLDAARIGIDTCGLMMLKKARAGMNSAAHMSEETCPSRAVVMKTTDGNIGSRCHPSRVEPNASSAEEIKTKTAPANRTGMSVNGIVATSAGAG